MATADASVSARPSDDDAPLVAILETLTELARNLLERAGGVAVEARTPCFTEPLRATSGSIDHGAEARHARVSVDGIDVTVWAAAGAGDQPDEVTLALLCRHVAALLAAYEAWDHERDGLQLAIQGRDVIGQAKGILIEREGLSSDGAFDHLRELSQRRNTKLRELAADLVRTSGGNRRLRTAPPPPPGPDAAPPRTGEPTRPRGAPGAR